MGQFLQDGESEQNMAKKGKSKKINLQDDGHINSGPAVHV